MAAQLKGAPNENVTVLPRLTRRQYDNFGNFLDGDLQKITGISGIEEFPDLTPAFVGILGRIRLNCSGGIIDLVIPNDISIDVAAWIQRVSPRQQALASRSIHFQEDVSIVARAIIYLKTDTKVLTCAPHDPRVLETVKRDVVEPAPITVSNIMVQLYMFACSKQIPSLADNIKTYWLHRMRSCLNFAELGLSIDDEELSEMVTSLHQIVPDNDQLRKATTQCYSELVVGIRRRYVEPGYMGDLSYSHNQG